MEEIELKCAHWLAFVFFKKKKTYSQKCEYCVFQSNPGSENFQDSVM